MNNYLFLMLYMFKNTLMNTIKNLEQKNYVQNYTFEHKYKKIKSFQQLFIHYKKVNP